MSKLYEKVFKHPTLNSILDEYILTFLNREYQPENTIFSKSDLRKACWLASILAESEVEEHKQKAQIFAALLYILNKDDLAISQLSYIIFSRTGNLLATRYLEDLFEEQSTDFASDIFKYSFGAILDYEIGFKRSENTINFEKGSVLATDFQKELWKSLLIEKNLCISAPTSSGKSFILQKFIQVEFNTSASLHVLYIVPSKALLNEVSDDFRQTLGSDVIIKTAYIDEGDSDANKLLYILTPERCLKLLQKSSEGYFTPNIVFVDEIQNVEDEHGRGVLMEFVLEEIAKVWTQAKLICAGPFIENSGQLFERVFSKLGQPVETSLSPVFQVKTSVRLKVEKNELNIYIQAFETNKPLRLTIPMELQAFKKATFGQKIAHIVSVLGNRGQSIVYSSRTDLVESWALQLGEKKGEIPVAEDVDYLIEYLAEEIHPSYYLIKCLKANVAFHHSKLPDIVRREIEQLFKRGDIEHLFCTSTLLQGVNLPANNLFITSPKKKNMDLSPFEFGNLSGRAGRINDSLFGTIFCIEKDGTDESWGAHYYSKSYTKEVIPATTKALREPSFLEELRKNPEDISTSGMGYAISLIRHKYLANKTTAVDYLASKGQSEESIRIMTETLADTLGNIQLPSQVLKLNPSIDPILQNKLYNMMKNEGINNWVLVPNPNFYKKIGKEYLSAYSYSELSFYWQFSTLCEKLDSIFKIQSEGYFRHDISLSIRSIAYFGFRWLQNRSYKEIIEDDIKFHADIRKQIDPTRDSDVNMRINAVINIHTKIVTFLLVKYFKLLTDILEHMLSDEEKEKAKLTLSLPIMLELGTTEPIVIQLISSGITRSVALKIFGEFKKVPGYLNVDVFKWLRDRGNKLNLKPIYLRYLKHLNYIN